MQAYDPKNIEEKWQKKWLEEGVYEPDLDGAKKPFYNLMMFPYPSAEGLHVGNMYAFTGSDIYGRTKRMQGNDVFEPIGLDGFGIHSENYALKIGAHPAEQAKVSEKRFYEQLQKIGDGFAWNERLETYDPEYYRWTQRLFVQMWKHNLAYRKKQSVNWCPKDLTVLADEQVEGGKCERCGSVVEKRDLEQWFFHITAYADRLLDNIEKLDWSEKVKIAQRNWIGRSEGAEITFAIKAPGDAGANLEARVFTTRPDTLFGATYLVLAPEHPLVAELAPKVKNATEVGEYVVAAKNKKEEERIEEGKDKTGVPLADIFAVNPANGKEIPVWVADYVLGSYGTGAIMAVPAHDERDFAFAKKFDLPIIEVIKPRDEGGAREEKQEALYTGDGTLANSGKFDGMDSEKAKWEITTLVKGERRMQYRLRDWLISRQRYWGPPIPMIFCGACADAQKGEHADMPGWYAVKEEDLPIALPFVKDFRPTGSGVSPLAADKTFYETKCPACGGAARRETDVSDTFLDSAWYYLRYIDAKNGEAPFSKERTKKWLPVDMYIGGAEHSVLHLLYVRFATMALKDWEFIDFEEPFKKFRAHGLLIKDGAKMSKSKGNVVNPDEYIENFGADTLRMYLMFLAPFDQGGDFRDAGVLGIERFLKRVWLLASGPLKETSGSGALLHKTVKKVTEDIEKLHYNTAVSALMILLRGFEESGATRDELEIFLKLLAPFAPHITEEIWREALGHTSSIHQEQWPSYDATLLTGDTVTLILQVNGKVRDMVTAPATLTEEAAKALALENPKVKKAMGGATPQRVVYVEKRLVNVVI